MILPADPIERIQSLMTKHQIEHYGWAALEKPMTLEFYKSWIEAGHHGNMTYLAEHLPSKAEPTRLLPRARTALVVAVSYVPHPYSEGFTDFKGPRIAAYARGEDYHFWLKKRLEDLVSDLKVEFPDDAFISFVDSGPVLERDLARRAGLGWIGKNTCLINQERGSFLFLSEIYTSLKITAQLEEAPDRCGTCTRCLDACPTQALIAPRMLDATRCISYLTIESKDAPEPALRPKIQDWYYGCDICQTVCPWNKKIIARADSSFETNDEALVEDLRFILISSHGEIERFFKGTALLRARPWMHKRNALIVVANRKLVVLRLEVEKLMTHARVGDIARWTLEQLNAISSV